MQKVNGTVVGQDEPLPETTSLVGGIQGIWDKVKGPIAFFALGFITCKVVDRKKLLKV